MQSVDASTFNSGKLNVTIQQKYTYVDNKYWFPEQLNFQIAIGEGLSGVTYVGKSYLSKIMNYSNSFIKTIGSQSENLI